MAVPDYQSFMLPLLKVAASSDERRLSEVTEIIAAQMGLTENDRDELLPSGTQTKLVNRVGWAKTYLTKAGLLESVGHRRFRISARGRQVLSTKPTSINVAFLTQFPEFRQFRALARQEQESNGSADDEAVQTPQESLEASYQRLRRELAAELLERIRGCPPQFFEKLVVDLLVSMGYGGSRRDAGQAIGRSGDGGIDGIIKEDKLGLDVIYIQAKRWDANIGRPVVQGFAGSLMGQRAGRGVFITTSRFTQDATEFVKHIDKTIVLMDGEQLAQLMIDHGVGVAEVATYSVKKIDSDYFGDDL